MPSSLAPYSIVIPQRSTDGLSFTESILSGSNMFLKTNTSGTLVLSSVSYSSYPDITDDGMGHVGINNITPQSALDVVGNIALTGYISPTNTTITGSNIIGYGAGSFPVNVNYCNFFGYSAGNYASNAYNSNFFGSSAGGFATNANNSNFFGYGAGYKASEANNSNFLGNESGNNAVSASNSNFFGQNSGLDAANGYHSNFFGSNAGNGATNANNSIFIGYQSGYLDTVNNSTAKSSILIGDYTSTGGFSDSICIGKGTQAPTSASLNIGNVIYATNIYNNSNYTSSAVTGSKVGIGTNSPINALDVVGNISCSIITASLVGTVQLFNPTTGTWYSLTISGSFGNEIIKIISV